MSLPPAAAVPAELRTDTTEVIDVPTSHTGTFESWEDADEAATRVVTMADGSPAPSTTLQMDWDEEEPPTQMRGEGGISQPKPVVDVDWGDDDVQTHMRDGGATAGYTPAPGSGRPSPFPSSRPSAPILQTPSVRPGAPSPFVSSEVDTAWGQELQVDRRPLWLIAAGAIAIVALAFLTRALLAAPTPGLITLATSPSDARVIVDGKAVSGTSSPYSATDLTPGTVHELVVQRPGYVEYRTLFTLSEGEAKTLPTVKLDAEPGEAVVAAAAMPAEAAPQAAAVPSATAAATSQPSEPAPAKVKASESKRSARKAARHERRARLRAAAASRGARVAAAPKRAIAKPVAAAGGMGVLRINSRPWAQVFVDGRMVGNTPQMGVQLSPGKHTIKLVNPQMGLQKTLSVSVKNGQTVTKVLNLIE